MYLPYQVRKLPIQFDAQKLQAELARIPEDWWVPHHFEDTGHDVLLLIATNGTLKNSDGSANHTLLPPFKPTEYLRSLCYFREVLYSFGATPSRARLMKLHPGESLKPHRDLHPHWNNKVRIHIPVVTHPDVSWHMWRAEPECNESDHMRVHMGPGEVWVFNTFYYHAVSNPTSDLRVHLVGDFELQGKLHDHIFSGCLPGEIARTKGFRYPPYVPDKDVRRWAYGSGSVGKQDSFDP